MVGPGEVDEDLQPETTEECSKYGEVANCLVYEVRNETVYWELCTYMYEHAADNRIPCRIDYVHTNL